MRLEFLAGDSQDRPLIRLSHFTPTEVTGLVNAAADLASERVQRVAVDELPGIEPLAGCRLTLCLRRWDQGVIRIGPVEFECGLTAGTWENVAGLIEPFAHGSGGFQWLIGAPGESALLLSASGEW